MRKIITLFIFAVGACVELMAANKYVLGIGLNSVDPAKYEGWSGNLTPCEADARFYTELPASGPNVTKKLLLSQAATYSAVTNAITEIRLAAKTGDLVIIGYSGHGTQVADANGDELQNDPRDKLDEAWCLYDGLLLDDELYELWSQFAEGVDIVVISDSCHAGTMTKDAAPILGTWSQFVIAEKVQKQQSASLMKLEKLGGPKERVAAMREKAGVDVTVSRIKERTTPKVTEENLDANITVAAIKTMPFVENVLFREKYDPIYAARQSNLKGETQPLKASVYLFAACADDQTSLAPPSYPFSLYTFYLREAWNKGSYNGSFRTLLAASRDMLPNSLRKDHTPQEYLIGALANRLAEKPAFK